jgi:hypothetical protein
MTEEEQTRAMEVGVGQCMPKSTILREVVIRDALCRVECILKKLPEVARHYLAIQKGASSEGFAFEVVASLALALSKDVFRNCTAAPEFWSQTLAEFLTSLKTSLPKRVTICFPDNYAGPDMVIAGTVPGAGSKPALKVLCVQAKRVKKLGGKELAHAFRTTDLTKTYHRLDGRKRIGTFSDQADTISKWHAENKGAVVRILLCTDCSPKMAHTSDVTVWTPENHELKLGDTSVWDMLSVKKGEGKKGKGS